MEEEEEQEEEEQEEEEEEGEEKQDSILLWRLHYIVLYIVVRENNLKCLQLKIYPINILKSYYHHSISNI